LKLKRLNWKVNGRIIKKQIHIATPHAKPSKCRDQIIARRKSNDGYKKKVSAGEAERISLKRENKQPKKGYFYSLESIPETIQPLPYVDLV
jgi:large subunit ribosomal protein L21e